MSGARPTMPDQPLRNQVAVVAGATRGAGRGIARMLGAAGATVYCTGRSVRGQPATGIRPETIEETAELVTAAGGRGIPIQVDHTVETQVEALFTRVRTEERPQGTTSHDHPRRAAGGCRGTCRMRSVACGRIGHVAAQDVQTSLSG